MALPVKLNSILKQLRESEDKAPRRRKIIRAANDRAPENTFVLRTKSNIEIAAAEVQTARQKLEDVNTQLFISLKAGRTNGSIH